MTSITIAAVVLTVSATATRMTAATVAPTCGIRSSSPVMSASTIGKGRPSAHAETPATVPATTEIAMLPISEVDTTRMDSSTAGRQRRSTDGGVNPKSQSVMVGRSISRKSARKVSVTSDRTEPNTAPAAPSSVFAASGNPAARSFSAEAIFWSASAVDVIVWKPSVFVSWSQYSGSSWTNSTIWSQTGPAASTTSAKTEANSSANTSSAARPRFQPRRTSAPTIGSSPSARTAARKIESSVPSDRIASATRKPTPSSMSTVRPETKTSTRCAGGSCPWFIRGAPIRSCGGGGDRSARAGPPTSSALRR